MARDEEGSEAWFSDIEYRTQKAIKRSMLADYLAHQPVGDYQSVMYGFPDEDVIFLKVKDYDGPFPDEGPEEGSRWSMYFDGASNALGNDIGAVIISPKGSHTPFTA